MSIINSFPARGALLRTSDGDAGGRDGYEAGPDARFVNACLPPCHKMGKCQSHSRLPCLGNGYTMIPVKPCVVPILAVCLAALSPAEEIWVQGVNAQSGWYDANKRFDGVDDYLCWAAAASNVLSWWQDRNAELAIASGAPLGNDAIWSDFVKSFGNWNQDKKEYGGYEVDGFHWYLDGTIDTAEYHLSEYGMEHGGYYRNLVSTEDCSEQIFVDEYYSTAENTTNAILHALTTGCGVTLGVYSTTWGHALTLWGVECIDGAITKMYLTDSDDERVDQHGLFTVSCEARDMDVVVWGTTVKRNVLHIESTEMYGDKKYFGEDVYIGDFTWLSPTLPRIPEPATGTLALLALAAMAAHRRRR